MKARDYRKIAKSKLKNDTGTFMLITFIEALISIALVYTIVGSIIITGPISLGIAGCYLAGMRDENVSIENMFSGFGNFLSAFVLELVNAILVCLWSLLLIVPGIVASLSYSMSFFILNDNKTLTASEARRKSVELMKGHKWELFCLNFSFIGWFLLSILTFGILLLWVIPYMGLANAEFYKELKKESETNNNSEDVQIEVVA